MEEKLERKRILSALFDVKPTNAAGDLDMAKIKQARRILDLRGIKSGQEIGQREKALKVEAIDRPIRSREDLSDSEQFLLDRLEADFGPLDFVQLTEEEVASKTDISPKSVSSQSIREQSRVVDLSKKESLPEEPTDKAMDDEEYGRDIIEAILSRPDEELLAEMKAADKREINKADEDIIEKMFGRPGQDEPAEESVEAEDSYNGPVEKPTLVSSRDAADERYTLPSKEEILLELEDIDDQEDLMIKSQLASAEDSAAGVGKDIHSQKPAKELTELEKIYLQEDAGPSSPQYSFAYDPQSDYRMTLPQPIETAVSQRYNWSRSLAGFIVTGILIALIIPGATLLSRGLSIRNEVMSSGMAAVQNLLAAKESIEETDWQVAEQNFGLAHKNFIQAHQEIDKLGQVTINILERVPGGSLVSSGSHLVKVGEHLAEVGQNLSAAVSLFSFDDWFSSIDLSSVEQEGQLLGGQTEDLTDLLNSGRYSLIEAAEGVRLANRELRQVKADSLPADIQEGVVLLQQKLPTIEELLDSALVYSEALLDILGHESPQQYLLLFQNNSEIRATGGFIGTYGLLKLYKGEIRELLVEGVFNADGQLHEKVIPPKPIQKISTAWSMHDANWFADFPTSAEKISWFYEKTGGPTVDGVISFTPTLIERLLKLTGPVEMPQYQVSLSSDNFVEIIQYKVEVDYDKDLNRPKQILADFTPKFIEKLKNLSSQQHKEAMKIIIDCLAEKHILIYFKDDGLENFVSNEGWAGEILSADKDYLSVVSSNINGFKTDRVIKETIRHQAEIQGDGSIIDTLTIIRRHEGGDLKYDWWNRVNANYLRVYLPLGSQLISAEGQSIESYSPPIDYKESGFKEDALVSSIEKDMKIDAKSGTHIFTESSKTVFGNWVYVSPGETATLTYKYRLPFKINSAKSTDSYSLLAQKQSGSSASSFSHTLKYFNDWQVSWQHPRELTVESGTINYLGDLKKDRFLGVAFEY